MKQLRNGKPVFLLAFVVFLTLAAGLNTAELDRAYFKENIVVNSTNLKLTGTGRALPADCSLAP